LLLIEYNTDDVDLVPCRAHETDAGADLRAAEDYIIRPHTAELVDTGIRIAIPQGYFGMVVSRSGHGKHRISLANRVGIIDSDYRGNIMVRLENLGDTDFVIKRLDRVAQLIITPCLLPDFVLSEELDQTARGTGGFGSTGVA
jgi:dUTP pyrophosphatase